MDPRLDGIFRKLDRADAHLENLESALEGFLGGNPYRVVSRQDPDTGECVLSRQVVKRPPLLDWGVSIGEIVHHLRSALDHLTWQLALIHHPDRDPPRNTAFPVIHDNDSKFADRVRTTTTGLSAQMRRVIEDLQPAQRSDRPWADPLWVLHRLANDDKHRVLLLTQAVTDAVGYVVDFHLEAKMEASGFMLLGRFDDGSEVGRLPGTADCEALAAKLNVTYGIAFDPEGPARGRPVLTQLELCREAVRNEVIPRFLPFFGS